VYTNAFSPAAADPSSQCPHAALPKLRLTFNTGKSGKSPFKAAEALKNDAASIAEGFDNADGNPPSPARKRAPKKVPVKKTQASKKSTNKRKGFGSQLKMFIHDFHSL
jgi:hypothetical protein